MKQEEGNISRIDSSNFKLKSKTGKVDGQNELSMGNAILASWCSVPGCRGRWLSAEMREEYDVYNKEAQAEGKMGGREVKA